MTIRYDVPYGAHPRYRADVFIPKHNLTQTTIVFWHGGSWRSGNKKTYRPLGRALARLGYRVVLPNYRLYPEVTFPAFVEDGAAAVAWVKREFGPTKIVAMGHSAGALIAALVAIDKDYIAAADAPGAVVGWIGLSGPYDFKPAKSLRPIFNGEKRVQVATPAKPPVPALLIHGRADRIVAVSNSTTLARVLTTAGARVELKLYGHIGHFTILGPFFVDWWLLPSLKRKLTQFIESL